MTQFQKIAFKARRNRFQVLSSSPLGYFFHTILICSKGKYDGEVIDIVHTIQGRVDSAEVTAPGKKGEALFILPNVDNFNER